VIFDLEKIVSLPAGVQKKKTSQDLYGDEIPHWVIFLMLLVYSPGAAIATMPQTAPKQNATRDHFLSNRKSLQKNWAQW
jgi:hypothetical protein